MKPLIFFQAKGGQGATTTAVAAALLSAEVQPTVLASHEPDVLAYYDIDGVPFLRSFSIPGFTYGDAVSYASDAGARLIYDAGTKPPPNNGEMVLVTRNCYLSLRATRHRFSVLSGYGAVLIQSSAAVLNQSDVRHALDVEQLITLNDSPAVRRTVDAGLMARRLPEIYKTPAFTELARGHGEL